MKFKILGSLLIIGVLFVLVSLAACGDARQTTEGSYSTEEVQ